MAKAVWNNEVIAESANTVMVEGNHYFPEDSVKKEYFQRTDTSTMCPWKGKATYFTLEVNGEKNVDAAWSYPQPKDAARNIKDHFAFWRGVTVTE